LVGMVAAFRGIAEVLDAAPPGLPSQTSTCAEGSKKWSRLQRQPGSSPEGETSARQSNERQQRDHCEHGHAGPVSSTAPTCGSTAAVCKAWI